jgi:hypothetical protein
LKQTILEFGTGTGGFISHGTEGNLTFHVGEREEITFIGLDNVLVETGSRLGAKLVTGIDVLRGRTLTSHVWGSAIQHSIGSAAATIKSTGLGIHENLIGRLYWGNGSLVLNTGKARLKLIRHLLLHENIYLRSPFL